MGTVMHLLLIRFAFVVGAVVLLIILGFTMAMVLKRRGRLNDARRYAEPLLRAFAEERNDRPARFAPGRAGTRGGARRTAVRALLRYLDDAPARDRRGPSR